MTPPCPTRDCILARRCTSDKRSYEAAITRWNTKISALSDDVGTVLSDARLKPSWHDFDPKDDQSARDRQEATAWCVHGTVKTAAEQSLWDRWFAESPDDPYPTLWGAVTALDPDLGAYLVGKRFPDVGKVDKANDIAKNLREAFIVAVHSPCRALTSLPPECVA